MAQQEIDVGSLAGDGTGDPLRDAFTKINENFTELYGTVNSEGLTYGNIASNVAGITFNVSRLAESYSASPVLRGTGQVVGNVYLIRGNVLGGTTPVNDVLLTVTTLANATVGNIATVSAAGVPVAPVLRVNGLTGNVTLTVNNINGAASKAYVNAAISANVANVTGSVTDSLRANITAANAIISNHSGRIATLESNTTAQAVQINNLVSTKANVSYVDTSIDLALSSNAILANVQSVNANVAAANAAILLRANLTSANFTGNISANTISATNYIRTNTYFIGGSEINQGQGQSWANPAALFFGNSAGSPGSKYYQINLQNLDPQGSGDIVVTSDDGNDAMNFISIGISGSQFNDNFYPSMSPHDGYVFITGGNLDLQSNTGNVEIISGNLTTGQIIVTQSNIVKLGTGVRIQFADGTLQSTAFGGNTNTTAINANIAAANAAIVALQANAAVQSLDIENLFANAASQSSTLISVISNAAGQATQIDLINSNIGAYQVFANSNAASQSISITSINANIFAANLNISTLLSNAASQALTLDNLQSNAQAQQGNILSLQSNSVTQAVQIDLLNSNAAVANVNISTLTSNAATQATQIALINANLTAANILISGLQSNAASQELDIDNLYANINFYLANVASSNANIAAANVAIAQLQSNAAAQESRLIIIDANVSAANLAITNLTTTKANLSGAIFNGNIQANYVIANANVKISSTLEVGQATPVVYPGLAGVFVGNVDSYYQVVVQNLSNGSSASGDFVITADDGDDSNNYINIGLNNSGWSGNFEVPAGDTGVPEFAHDGYITTIGGNTALRSDQNVFLVANTSVVGLVKDGDFGLFGGNLRFTDGTVQSTAITDVPGLYANIGTAYSNIDSINSNIGAYQTYANSTIYTNSNVTNYLQAVTGNIIPAANLTYTLGNVNYQWKEIHVSGNTIFMGGIPLSTSYINDYGSLSLGANSYVQFGTFVDSPENTYHDLISLRAGYDGNEASNFHFASNGAMIVGTNFRILPRDLLSSGSPEQATGNITIGNLIALSNVIGNVSYTPANAANYNSTITNIQQALDELAARIKALGG